MAVCLHLHTCKPVRSLLFFFLQDILHLAMGAYVLYGASMHTWTCRRCDKPASLWCGGCKTVNYCSSECQRASWKEHKPVCYAVSNALRERGTFQVFLCNFLSCFVHSGYLERGAGALVSVVNGKGTHIDFLDSWHSSVDRFVHTLHLTLICYRPGFLSLNIWCSCMDYNGTREHVALCLQF